LKSAIHKKIVLIGASTGGPGQIQKILSSLPTLNNVSVVVAQHMVEGFLSSFASRLQHTTNNNVTIIQDKQDFETASIYIAEAITSLNTQSLKFSKEDIQMHSYNPNIDTLFNSFTPLCNNVEILCVILTGIGSDGVDACKNLHSAGAICMTESESSAIVDGMPNRARTLIPKIEIYNIEEIIKKISEFCYV